jgi:hypothetical protein
MPFTWRPLWCVYPRPVARTSCKVRSFKHMRPPSICGGLVALIQAGATEVLPLGRCTLVPEKTTVKGAKVRISFVRSHLLPIVLVVLPRPGADPAPDPDLGRRFAQILTLAFQTRANPRPRFFFVSAVPLHHLSFSMETDQPFGKKESSNRRSTRAAPGLDKAANTDYPKHPITELLLWPK